MYFLHREEAGFCGHLYWCLAPSMLQLWGGSLGRQEKLSGLLVQANPIIGRALTQSFTGEEAWGKAEVSPATVA